MDRIFAVPTSARHRLHAVAAGAALAFMAGLSAPAAAIGSTAGSTDQASTASQAQASVERVANVTTASGGANPAPAKPAAPAAAAKPSAKQLHPHGVGGGQEHFTPSPEQLKNARAIIQTGQKLGLPPRAWVIALATALQESALHNLGNLGDSNDHDSLGLFQQRPSSGWGTPSQVRNPAYASTAFYNGLTAVNGWDKMDLTDAAQAVQVSAYPDHYAKWEAQAGDLVRGFYFEGPFAAQVIALK